MNLNDKIQFSFLVPGHGLPRYFKPEDSNGNLLDEQGKRHLTFSFPCRNPEETIKICVFGTNRTEFGTHSKVYNNIKIELCLNILELTKTPVL
jgi:hypothetical protein